MSSSSATVISEGKSLQRLGVDTSKIDNKSYEVPSNSTGALPPRPHSGGSAFNGARLSGGAGRKRVAFNGGSAGRGSALTSQPSIVSRMMEEQDEGSIDPKDVATLLPGQLLQSKSLDLDSFLKHVDAANAANAALDTIKDDEELGVDPTAVEQLSSSGVCTDSLTSGTSENTMAWVQSPRNSREAMGASGDMKEDEMASCFDILPPLSTLVRHPLKTEGSGGSDTFSSTTPQYQQVRTPFAQDSSPHQLASPFQQESLKSLPKSSTELGKNGSELGTDTQALTSPFARENRSGFDKDMDAVVVVQSNSVDLPDDDLAPGKDVVVPSRDLGHKHRAGKPEGLHRQNSGSLNRQGSGRLFRQNSGGYAWSYFGGLVRQGSGGLGGLIRQNSNNGWFGSTKVRPGSVQGWPVGSSSFANMLDAAAFGYGPDLEQEGLQEAPRGPQEGSPQNMGSPPLLPHQDAATDRGAPFFGVGTPSLAESPMMMYPSYPDASYNPSYPGQYGPLMMPSPGGYPMQMPYDPSALGGLQYYPMYSPGSQYWHSQMPVQDPMAMFNAATAAGMGGGSLPQSVFQSSVTGASHAMPPLFAPQGHTSNQGVSPRSSAAYPSHSLAQPMGSGGSMSTASTGISPVNSTDASGIPVAPPPMPLSSPYGSIPLSKVAILSEGTATPAVIVPLTAQSAALMGLSPQGYMDYMDPHAAYPERQSRPDARGDDRYRSRSSSSEASGRSGRSGRRYASSSSGKKYDDRSRPAEEDDVEDPQTKLAWCHIQHSRKVMPKLKSETVKKLVQLQLQSKEPIRAPWYRHEARAPGSKSPLASPRISAMMNRNKPPQQQQQQQYDWAPPVEEEAPVKAPPKGPPMQKPKGTGVFICGR